MKYGIYRVYPNCSWRLHSQGVRRNGKLVQFKTKKEAERWIKENEHDRGDYEWSVRRIIKPVR